MAFTVEDGTGLADSNAYMTVAEYRAHHEDRGDDTTEVTNGAIEAAVVKATDYADKRWPYRGWKRRRSQALQWPRHNAVDDSGHDLVGVPSQLKKAVAEYAKLAMGQTRDLAESEVDQNVVRRTEQVGPLEETTEWDRFASSMEYPQADRWLTELVENRRTVVRG